MKEIYCYNLNNLQNGITVMEVIDEEYLINSKNEKKLKTLEIKGKKYNKHYQVEELEENKEILIFQDYVISLDGFEKTYLSYNRDLLIKKYVCDCYKKIEQLKEISKKLAEVKEVEIISNTERDNSNKFYFEEEESLGEKKLYSAFEMIYRLASKGQINLEHDEIETNGVKVIL